MIQFFVSALPIALLWVIVTGRVEWGSLLVGYIIGILTLMTLNVFGIRLQGMIKPRQLIALSRYSGLLLWNGLLSSLQLAKMLLRPKLELKTGIIAFDTGDRSPEQRLAALSAHGMNMTPGTLVIDFNDEGTLYVHILDYESANSSLKSDQDERIKLLRELLGTTDGRINDGGE